MKRREFIALVGGAGAAWPFAARAQQQAVSVIGFLRNSLPGGSGHLLSALPEGLTEGGYIEGRNAVIEYRWSEDRDQLTGLAADLVRRHCTVIIAGGNAAAAAAKAATATIPNAVIPSRDFQLDSDVAAVFIEGEDVDEPPADRELNAGYPFFIVESQARFDQAEVPDEVVPQISLEGELPRGLPTAFIFRLDFPRDVLRLACRLLLNVFLVEGQGIGFWPPQPETVGTELLK
jgi:hypothetical protein